MKYEVIKEKDGCFIDTLDEFDDLEEAVKYCKTKAKTGEDGWDYEVLDTETDKIIFRANNKGSLIWI